MTQTTEHAVHWYDDNDKTEIISFCIRCDTAAATQKFEIQSDRSTFEFNVLQSNNKYWFSIITASSDFTLLQKYKQCNFRQPHNPGWTSSKLIYHFFGNYRVDVGIPRAKLQATNQNYELEFRLISARTPTTAPVSSEPMYTSVLMDRYYRNNASHDVFFSCEDGSFDNSGKGQNNKGQNYDDQNYDDQSHIGKSDIDLENKTVKPVEASTLGAHRFVLSQWPYFKAMFESEFEEGCSGAKTIRVKGVRLRTFQIMIQFMYMGTLKSDIATLYEDNAAGQASWEGLYIAADRYRIDDLRKLALTTIERKLDSIAAIDFLFRSAYLYPELRDPVIKYIAKEHHAEISKREVREAHKDHPEFSDLLGELYEAFHELMANKGFLDSRPGILYRR